MPQITNASGPDLEPTREIHLLLIPERDRVSEVSAAVRHVLEIVLAVLVTAKVGQVIDVSWWVVLSPVWIPASLAAVVAAWIAVRNAVRSDAS